MPQGNDFTVVNPTETVTVTWDFGPWIAAGVTVSTPSTTCTLLSGTDTTPNVRLIGSPQVTTSPTKNTANQAVLQQIQGMLAGSKYILLCTVSTSDNQVLTLFAHQECRAPS